MANNVQKIKRPTHGLQSDDPGGAAPMDTYIYNELLNVRFAYIEENIKEIRHDLRDQGNKIDTLKYWIIGAVFALAALFFAVVGYHTMVMQSQYQIFSEYVKAVTQPLLPKIPPK